MVTSALNNLKNIQRSMEDVKKVCDNYITNVNDDIITMANRFDLNVEQIHSEFQIKRIAKKKKIFTYEKEEHLITTPEKKFTAEVYNIVLDTIIISMTTRFVKNNSLYCDLSLLSPTNFPLNDVPKISLLTLANKLKSFLNCDGGVSDVQKIRNKLLEELNNFSNSWKYLKNSLQYEYNSLNMLNDISDEDQNQEEDD